MPSSKIAVSVLFALVLASCSESDDRLRSEVAGGADDREVFNDEADGVRAVVADCFVVEVADDGRRYRTTIEVENGSGVAQTITVTVDADLGRGGVSDSFEVPAGARDAWAVTSEEETTDPVGNVECADYITGIGVTLSPGGG